MLLKTAARYATVVAVSFFIAGCGGGDGGSTTPQSPPQEATPLEYTAIGGGDTAGAGQTKIVTVDLLCDPDSYDNSEEYSTDLLHLSDHGHSVVAARIYSQIKATVPALPLLVPHEPCTSDELRSSIRLT